MLYGQKILQQTLFKRNKMINYCQGKHKYSIKHHSDLIFTKEEKSPDF
jgi:hypothetical protein